MAWPSGTIPVTHLDADADSPLSARPAIKETVDQVNVIRDNGQPALLAGSSVQLFSVADATAATHAVNRQFGDGRYTPIAFGIPVGGIILWSGSTASIPSGWFLCNGANGTPNLSGRFVIGTTTGYAVGATGGGTMPQHNHTASTDSTEAHTHTMTPTLNNIGGTRRMATFQDSNEGTALPTSSAGAHSHTVTVANAGTGTEVIAKYYALAYIMKGA